MQNLKPLAAFCGYVCQFEAALVGNPKDRFSRDKAHFVCFKEFWRYSNVTCSAYPLTEIDSISANGEPSKS